MNALHTIDGLLVEDSVVLALRRVGDFERFFLADEPSSEFMPMTVVGVQNLF